MFFCSKDILWAFMGVFFSLACCRVGANEPKEAAKARDPVESGIAEYLKLLDLSPARPGEEFPAREDYRCVKGSGEGIPAGLDILWLRTFRKCQMPRENGFVFLWHDEATLKSFFPKAGSFENNSLGRMSFFESGMTTRSGKFALPSGVAGWWAVMKVPFKNLKSSAGRLGEAKFTAARFNHNAAWGKDPETSTTSSIPDGEHPHRPDRWLSFLTK